MPNHPPLDTRVQMNVTIPWDFREFLKEKAKAQNTGLGAFIVDTLKQTYGAEFARQQAQSPR